MNNPGLKVISEKGLGPQTFADVIFTITWDDEYEKVTRSGRKIIKVYLLRPRGEQTGPTGKMPPQYVKFWNFDKIT